VCAADDASSARELDQTVERLEALVGQEQVSEDYVGFRIDLLKAQWAIRDALAGRAVPLPPTDEPCPTRGGHDGKRHAPVLEIDVVPLDRELLGQLWAALRETIEKAGRQSVGVSRLAGAAAEEPALLEELARKAALGPDHAYLESLGRRLDIPAEALLFFGRVLAAPFLAEAARHVGEIAPPTAHPADGSGRCGLCGSPPALAKLRRDDGRRILYCSLCGESGEFARLACPHCGNRDRDALTFLRLSASDPRWIEACEKCKRYIKTVDERKLPVGEPVIPVVEETATLHLDLLAEKEGYAPGLPYAATG
jgi:FdhE protein